MGFLDDFFESRKKKSCQFTADTAPVESLPASTELKKRISALTVEINKRLPTSPALKLKPCRGQTTLYSSKLGGTPYFPKSMEYPKVKKGEYAGEPLYFLAQLNFAELPAVEGFPQQGILQFFAGSKSDCVVGLDFDDGTNQNGFRVFYHREIITDEAQLLTHTDIPAHDDEEYSYPFKGEFALKAESVIREQPSIDDFRFMKIVVDSYNTLFGTSFENVWSYEANSIGKQDEELVDRLFEIYESINSTGTKMGGFPHFTQFDPRANSEQGEYFDTLLFQIDDNGDDCESLEDEIMFGDCGVANFFINSEALKNGDFTKVLYNWDCG